MVKEQLAQKRKSISISWANFEDSPHTESITVKVSQVDQDGKPKNAKTYIRDVILAVHEYYTTHPSKYSFYYVGYAKFTLHKLLKGYVTYNNKSNIWIRPTNVEFKRI